MPIPQYLYHAAPLSVFLLIKAGGLKALSKGGKNGTYLCASSDLNGATTLGRRANDVIFRIDTTGDLLWYQEGAGQAEWRKNSGVGVISLTCRRYQAKVGHHQQWRSLNAHEVEYLIKEGKKGPVETK